ncbi:MAG: LacI family transcriptional regulator [Victivallaceae bacterium]|nr:LacI family transcriptional regulator [Victivallaceae bacterium]
MINRNRKASRRDVAALAGVSVTTVTHALNATDGSRVKQETIDKVKQAALELGYRPSFVGRALVTGRSYTVGLLQPSHEAMFFNYYQHIIVGMVQAMEKRDYNLVILFPSDDFRYMKPINQGRVDGMLILQSFFDDTHINRVIDSGIPTVAVNKDIEVTNNLVGNVHSDHFKLMNNVVDELVALGCKQIISFHDYRAREPNHWMFEAFTKRSARYVNDGVIGTSIIPDYNNISQQIKNILSSVKPPLGIFVDGPDEGELFIQLAKSLNLTNGKDFFLISSSCVLGETTPSKGEVSAYTHQAEKIGATAWDVMWQILSGKDKPRKKLIPYLRFGVKNTG